MINETDPVMSLEYIKLSYSLYD